MARTVYIIAFAQQAGRSTAALGLMELLSARGMVAATGQPVFVADCRNDSRFAARNLLDRRDGGAYGGDDVTRAALFADLAVQVLALGPEAMDA